MAVGAALEEVFAYLVEAFHHLGTLVEDLVVVGVVVASIVAVAVVAVVFVDSTAAVVAIVVVALLITPIIPLSFLWIWRLYLPFIEF